MLNRHVSTADVITAGFTLSELQVAGVVDIAELNRHFGIADLFKAASTYRVDFCFSRSCLWVVDLFKGGGPSELRDWPLVVLGGMEGVRKLLKSIIFEALVKYDAEIARCTSVQLFLFVHCGAEGWI